MIFTLDLCCNSRLSHFYLPGKVQTHGIPWDHQQPPAELLKHFHELILCDIVGIIADA